MIQFSQVAKLHRLLGVCVTYNDGGQLPTSANRGT